MPENLKSTKFNSAFRMDTAVSASINAPAEKIWKLLTDASGFPKWNSTVSSIEGSIALGEKLKIKVPLSPDRTFTPRVTHFEPAQSMVWSDGMAPMFKGTRTFSLSANSDGTTQFSMNEELTGLMLPMIKRSLPDFAPAFEAYAADLKRAAEGKS